MKLFNILTAGLLLCVGLASCEMKDELRGGGEGSSDMGYLDLGVVVNASQNNVSRADVTDDGENENIGVSVSAEKFPVTITGVTNAEYKKEFESYAKLKEESPLSLPVGTYTVTAHSDIELKEQMEVPYYEGIEEINITKGVESKANVVCTMKNTKISINYDTEFISNFIDWTITVTDGKTILTFSCTDHNDEVQLNPDPIYMLVADGVSQLTVRASAHNLKGEQVVEERLLTKPTGGNSTNWTGGDALTIKMEENTPTDPTGVQGSGITISADVSFDEEEETEEVSVTPGGSTEEPDEGGGDEPEDPTLSKPTVTFSQNTYTLPADASKNADAVITSTAEGGIQSVKVQIVGGNDNFSGIVSSMGFADGLELVGNITLGPVIGSIVQGLEMPQPGDTSYTFPVGGFFNILQQMGVTTEADGHVFNITVTDANGTASASLSVKVTE